ncbi:MAG: hypothetical protein IJZ20_08215, partial [Clostridia bacterium]|nr:hypothetical protein [Clostridia bacterium]
MKRRNRKLIGFVAGVFCCTAFSLAANALTLDVAEKSEQPLQEYTDVSRLNAESTMLGWDFETDSSKKEALWGIGENASFAYENGMLVFELENASETVEFVPKGVPDGQAVTAENGRYLVVRLRNLTNGNKMQFWYQTENMTAWDGESCAFTVPIVSGNSTFVTYTVDLSTWKNWSTSSFKTARLCFPGATDGRIELEEVYFTDTRPSGSDEYYSAMTQRFGITPKNGTAITASRTDNWASIIKTNVDGSFNFTGSARLENYSVWISPSLPADSSKIKYLVARCSPDFSLQEFVMLLADAENGRFQSWSINSTHYQVKKTGGQAYIIFNLESLGKLQGNIKQIQLFARVLSGTVYDAYWSSTGETADNLVDKAKMYVGADTIDEPLGKTELKSVYRMLNGDEKEVYYEVSDSDIASVVTDGGKTYLYAKNNGDVTLYAKCGDTVFAEKTITVTG